MKKICIAIDGPAGAGKSTIAKLLANKLNYEYLDTGAMYRAICWIALKENIKYSEEEKLQKLIYKYNILVKYEKAKTFVFANKQDITKEIRNPKVSNYVSLIARSKVVRQVLLKIQKQLSVAGGIIIEGRDIGTVVLPDAELKIFLDADINERIKRRHYQLKKKGMSIDYESLKKNIIERDLLDSMREISPLVKAYDAVEIDTTNTTAKEIINKIMTLYKEYLC